MSDAPAAPIPAIIGPTGSGKTALSLLVARALDAEIISMDSRAVFRGMEIGTAKPTAEQRRAVPHHGIDLTTPDQRFSAGDWNRYARRVIPEIVARGRVPLLVGGTGFFLRALTNPIFAEPPLDAEARARLASQFRTMSDANLATQLADVDPESAERLRAWGGRQRVERALEIALLTGRTLGWWHRNAPPAEPPLPVLPFVLDADRAALYDAVNTRVDDMARAGLVEEVRALVAQYGADAPGLNAHGYAELIPFLAGETTLEEALDAVRRNTRAYTKRQQTWLRTQLPAHSIRLDAGEPREELAERIVRGVRECGSA